MKKLKLIDNISGLQLFQLMKPVVFLIISIVFTKSHLTRAEIGQWEMFMFIAGLITFFWVTGIIQSLLPLYHRNKTYHKMGDNGTAKVAGDLQCISFTLLFQSPLFCLGHCLKHHFSVFQYLGQCSIY